MSRINSDEQFQFLLSCIRYSVNGKVDFSEVAKECNIVSKGAAAKRYERMMKAHGINPNGGPCPSASPDSKANTPTKNTAGSPNKRKSNVESPLSKKAKIKKTAIENAEKLVAPKQEDVSDNESKDTVSHTAYRSQAAIGDEKDDKDLFDQFCNTADDYAEDEELFAYSSRSIWIVGNALHGTHGIPRWHGIDTIKNLKMHIEPWKFQTVPDSVLWLGAYCIVAEVSPKKDL